MSEVLKDLTEAVEMFLLHSGKDDDVVHIKEARFPVEACEDTIHEAGEGGRSVAEAERDLVELKELAAAGAECRFLLVPLLDRDLPGGCRCEEWDMHLLSLPR